MMSQDLRARVTAQNDLGGGYVLSTLHAPAIAAGARPGEFVMVGAPDPADLLLRRAFSVCQTDGDLIRILYRIVGRGTSLIAHTPVGDPLAVLGPLGRGFTPPAAGERAVIVAGGIGSAAFPFLVEGLGASRERPLFFYGGRSSADLPFRDWFEARCETVVTTDDGSTGVHGLVTQPLEKFLGALAPAATATLRLYTCGPDPMMRAVARLAEAAGVRAEAAVESPMACGWGVCVGCVVPVREPRGAYDAYRRVCVDGPVFPTTELRW